MLIPSNDNALIINATIIRFTIVTFIGSLLIYLIDPPFYFVLLLIQQLSRHFLYFEHVSRRSWVTTTDFYDPSALRN